MKGIFKTAVAAAVIVGAAAQPHNHGHRHHHHHAKKYDHAAVEKREDTVVVVTKVVEGPVKIEYVMQDGQKVDPSKAEQGIEKGLYVVVGSTKPSFSAPPPIVSTSTAGPEHGGRFLEKTTSTTPTTSSAPPPETSSVAPPPKPKVTGIDAEFPSGELDCDKVPTDYGAVEIQWTGTHGWTTLAKFGKWIKGVAVDNIVSPIDGTCGPEMMCSYACPAGYQKTQWPEDSQGATGQSVGGLWCNEKGKLELTRPSHKTLCERGAGGVFVRNELSGNAAICRTDYPGNEAMVIPLDTYPGQIYELTNPDSKSYYKWKGMPTTAQYYVNNQGVEVEEACTWKSKKYPQEAGNWAPVNIGVGKSESGITYISIFPNLPTSHAVLNFDIEITGDISGTCWLKAGQYSGNNGCTVGLKPGGEAVIVFKNGS
ncbi:Sperm-associated antigen 4 protein [Madurella fahalii]|uniref:Sperm-associated antigen 4 protein n=1 Tax=Madurella fahalii TaxID=1157608 RepID=A0ABQ0G0N9_9PEZI